MGSRPRRARRASHAFVATVFTGAVGLVVGGAWRPERVASGQSAARATETPPAVALEARSEDGASALLPLVDESLTVRLDDGHATATYDDVFQNESKGRVEGTYRLTVGEGATATGFAYYNGGTKIVGEIFEREAARDVYEAITGLRRDPGLLEQAGEGGFTFRVFPIEPGEKKRVTVSTSRWLPRRGGPLEYRVRLGKPEAKVVVEVNDARGIASLESATHDIDVKRTSANAWAATVVRPKGPGDELVLRYEPGTPPLTLSARVHHDAGQAAFFTATIAAPAKEAKAARPSSDVTLVLDRSGSMQGESLDSARAAAKALVEKLQPDDRVNIVAFDDKVDALYTAPRVVSESVRREALEYIERIRAQGGTDIAKALAKALASQTRDEHPDVVLFLTDGQSDGPSAIKVASEDAGSARVFTVGLGGGVDKALLSRIATIKHGRFTFIADARSVVAEFPKVLSQLEEPVLTGLTLKAEGGKVERVYPEALGDVFPNDEIRVFGRVTGAGPVTLVLAGKEHGVERRFEARVDPVATASQPWVARSWARSRVDDVLEETRADGESEARKNEAVDLGLAYGLVTPYTSFLAIPEKELTEAAKSAVGTMREKRKALLASHKDAAALSRLNMPPGDPILKVHAPRDAKRVTAMFPFGLTQDLFYDAFSESWMTRFLVPTEVPDGTYEVPIVIVLADGTVTASVARYTIDGRGPTPEVDVRVDRDGVTLRVLVDEPAAEVRAALVPPDGAKPAQSTAAISLTAEPDRRTFGGRLALPPGRHRVRVVVADLARNEAERIVEVEVPR